MLMINIVYNVYMVFIYNHLPCVYLILKFKIVKYIHKLIIKQNVYNVMIVIINKKINVLKD